MDTDAAQYWMDSIERFGVAVTILLGIAALVAIHYFRVILPREQAKTADQRTESAARTEALARMAETSGSLAESYGRQTVILSRVQDAQRQQGEMQRRQGETLDEHGRRLLEIRDRLEMKQSEHARDTDQYPAFDKGK